MPSEDAVAAALRTGLIVPDTNVLLSLYRFQSEARDDLFRALEHLETRLWVPYQVGLEFHRNRLGVIDAQEKYFSATRVELNSAVKAYADKVKAFASRIALTKLREDELEEAINAVHKRVMDEIGRAENSNDVRLSTLNSDEVLTRLEVLLDNKVGGAMSQTDLADARKEALRRIEAKIPPGYMDKAKDDPTGDYLIWAQLKQEAEKRKVPVVFITDDRKEDWYRRAHGMTLGARLELREEMQSTAEVAFLVMTTGSFLVQAKKYLDVTVSPQTVHQAKDLAERVNYDSAIMALRDANEALSRTFSERQLIDGQIHSTEQRMQAIRRALQELSGSGLGKAEIAELSRGYDGELSAMEKRQHDLEMQRRRIIVDLGGRNEILEAAERALRILESEAAAKFPVMGEDEVLSPGDRVQHRRFGAGTILSNDSTKDLEYKIKFDDPKLGTKIIVASHAPMIKLS
jgi:rRNA-processing protein FCF1